MEDEDIGVCLTIRLIRRSPDWKLSRQALDAVGHWKKSSGSLPRAMAGHDWSQSWGRLAREGRRSGDAVPALVPVEIAFPSAPAPTCAPQPPSSPPAQRARGGIIEIELSGGFRVRVDRDVDAEALQRGLELLRRR